MMKGRGKTALLRLAQGALIGLGAVLPGVSGGVLCVVFGVYGPLMQLLADPLHRWREGLRTLWPVLLGAALGFLGVARLLGFFLERYPEPSVCLFVGLIAGMLPSLLRQAGEKGRGPGAWAALVLAAGAILGLLAGLQALDVRVAPGAAAYGLCGFCVALSVIAPGLSFSTLLMPLGLYTPFVTGLGRLEMPVALPALLGGLAGMALLPKAVTRLLETGYAQTMHAIVGVVLAATTWIIPFGSFASGPDACLMNLLCLVLGILLAMALERFNRSVEIPR